jgi:hypothetical protein
MDEIFEERRSMTECVTHEELNVFGKMLEMFLEQSEVSGLAELTESIRTENYDGPGEKELHAAMRATCLPKSMDNVVFWAQLKDALGLNSYESSCLHKAAEVVLVPLDINAKLVEQDLLKEAKSAVARKEITPLEELTEEEVDLERDLWWEAGKYIADAAYLLKRRWIFEEEGEELVRELNALQERIEPLARRVSLAHRRLRREE